MSEPRTELALVLHTHMPYVEGHGTWPFGEEWLWEAMASTYLPLLDVLDARVTLSLTPVLCDQLEAPGVGERFGVFLRDVRRETHRQDIAGHDDPAEVAALEHSAATYESALERFEALDGDLLGALAPHAAWTSAATHAILPLLATEAGVRLQVQTGIDAHRERFGEWRGGFWLPECAHATWLDPVLEEMGVHAACVELTDVVPGATTPLRTAAGPLLVPIDREIIDLAWSPSGYPSQGAYRDSFRHTHHDHMAWANDGAAYDPERAAAQARADAADFVARAAQRPGLCVCALDTELLGHWWHEGVTWLAAVLAEADRVGLPIAHLDDAVARHAAIDAPATLPVTTWGTPRDLTTWDGEPVADLAWAARRAELDLIAAGRDVSADAVRELLALQASDWAFMVTRDLAGDYPLERANGHREALAAELRTLGSASGSVRNLAPHASPLPLLEP